MILILFKLPSRLLACHHRFIFQLFGMTRSSLMTISCVKWLTIIETSILSLNLGHLSNPSMMKMATYCALFADCLRHQTAFYQGIYGKPMNTSLWLDTMLMIPYVLFFLSFIPLDVNLLRIQPEKSTVTNVLSCVGIILNL